MKPNPIQCVIIVGIFLFWGIAKAAAEVGAERTAGIAWAVFWVLLLCCLPLWLGPFLPEPTLPKNPDRPQGPPPEIKQ